MHWAWIIKRDNYWFEAAVPCTPAGWTSPGVPAYTGDTVFGNVEIIWYWESHPGFNITLRNCSGYHPWGRYGYHIAHFGESLAAAAGMVETYGLVYRPARNSRHNEGRAIDMTISWSGDLTISKKDGSTATIATYPRTGDNLELHAIGATYGVFKLVSDPPHWSEDDH